MADEVTIDSLVDEAMSELNLDDVGTTKQTIQSLVAQSIEMVKHSVNSNISTERYLQDQLFQRAVLTMTTQLLYDRTLENGMSLGFQMLVVHLQAEHGLEEADDDGNAKNG